MTPSRALLVALAALVLGCAASTDEPPIVARAWVRPDLPKDQVNLLFMGDWGNNSSNQRTVARVMADYASGQPYRFNGLVTAGDNFYVRLNSPQSPYFRSLFEEMYDPQKLDMPFYVALGNHDYDQPGKMDAELQYARLHPESRWKIPSRWYRVDFPEGSENPIATVLVLDSNRPRMSKEDWEKQKQWIDEQLSRPRAPWTIASAHHPLLSNGMYGDNGVLQTQWGPIFRKHNLDFYVCGHEHDLQHLAVPQWHTNFLLVGGGGAGKRQMRRDNRGPFSRSLYGFAHLTLTRRDMTGRFITTDGAPAHHFARAVGGPLDVVQTTGRDLPTTQPLRGIQGLDQRPATTRATTAPASGPISP